MSDSGDFIAALLDARQPAPTGLITPEGDPAARRFDVYRNNVAVGLTEALRDAFPALRAVMGQTAFDQVAAIFRRRHPPRSPVLTGFGAALPAFLDGFSRLARYPHLSDLARLERAMTESYHAADAPPVDPAMLAAVSPGKVASARVTLAPATRFLRSRWPIGSLRAAALSGTAPDPTAPGEAVLVLRPGFDPQAHILPPGGATFVMRLVDGASIGAATEAALAARADAPIAEILGLLIHGGGIAALDTTEDTR